jgi:hypothetical protein
METSGFRTVPPAARHRRSADDWAAVRLLGFEPPSQTGPAASVGGPAAVTRPETASGRADAEREWRRERIRFAQQMRARRRRSRQPTTRML